MDNQSAVEIFDLRSSCNAAGLPTGEQIKEIRRLLGKQKWSQEYLAHVANKFGFPISQSEISRLERGLESTPTKAGFREIRRAAKYPSNLVGFLESDISYRERLRLLFFRMGFIFLDESRILHLNSGNYLDWIESAAAEAGFEGQFDGTANAEDEERIWSAVKQNVRRIYPDIWNLAKNSTQDRDKILADFEGALTIADNMNDHK